MTANAGDYITRPLAKAWAAKGHSINADDWPGVLVKGDGWRLILSRSASAFVLQARSAGSAKWERVWASSSPADWASDLGGRFPDLPAAVVPFISITPNDAATVFLQRDGIPVPARSRLRYWSAPDYAGVLAIDCNMRSVRDRTGTLYAIQWTCPESEEGQGANWITQVKGPSWPDLVERLTPKTFETNEFQTDIDAVRLRLADLFAGCPDLAADGPWPVLVVGS